MLKQLTSAVGGNKRGDTLIEVTIALSILAFVLLGSTTVVTLAFRTGQTARERTSVAEAAQEQMEALRSYRDNSPSWASFKAGIDPVSSGFYMQLATVGATRQWVPVAGTLTPSTPSSTQLTVPTSTIQLSTGTSVIDRDCGYDFTLHYQFETIGGTIPASNEITTRLVNLHYQPGGGGPLCP